MVSYEFRFDIVNLPQLNVEVPDTTSYGVSQLIRSTIASNDTKDFNHRNKHITCILLQLGYDAINFLTSLWRFTSVTVVQQYREVQHQCKNMTVFYEDVVYKLNKGSAYLLSWIVSSDNFFLIVSINALEVCQERIFAPQL